MSRADHIRSLFPTGGQGLEIGPSHNPLMPRRDGFDVEILDYVDADGLRTKYAKAGLDVSAIEEVDHIGDGRPMTEVIGKSHCYDWIVASHVIEHVPDLVAFLGDCEQLLRPGGRLVLAVPDKRYCFDVLRPVSTIGQVLQAHVDRRVRPSPGVIFDDVAYARTRDGAIGWPIDARGRLAPNLPISVAFDAFKKARASDDYVDMHCWVFVPSSFQLIIRALAEFGLTSLCQVVFETAGGEFYVVLSAQPTPVASELDLGDLALAGYAEEQIAFAHDWAKSMPTQEASHDDVTEQMRGEISALRAQFVSVQAREAQLMAEVSALRSSTSWKITAPLRVLSGFLRSDSSNGGGRRR